MPLFAELRRRNVVRVAVLYVIASWVMLQAADVIFGVLDVPKWAAKLVLALLVLGFPVALVLSWIYEITPEGVQRQRYAARGSPSAGATARKLDVAIAVMAAIAIVGIVVDRLIPERLAAPAPPVAPSAIAARSIAVLPFVDMSQSKDQEYFADGLSEELMNLLTPVQGLRVIGRTSSFQFKGRNEDLRTIGEVLKRAHS